MVSQVSSQSGCQPTPPPLQKSQSPSSFSLKAIRFIDDASELCLGAVSAVTNPFWTLIGAGLGVLMERRQPLSLLTIDPNRIKQIRHPDIHPKLLWNCRVNSLLGSLVLAAGLLLTGRGGFLGNGSALLLGACAVSCFHKQVFYPLPVDLPPPPP